MNRHNTHVQQLRVFSILAHRSTAPSNSLVVDVFISHRQMNTELICSREVYNRDVILLEICDSH